MFKPSETKNVVAHVIKGGNVPMLLGGVGIGKSSIVKAVADELANGKEVKQGETNPKKGEFGFVDFRLALYETIDLNGLPYVDDGEQKKAFLGNLPKGGSGLLFFDEFAQAPASIQKVIGQLLDPKGKDDARRLGEYELPKGWSVVLAGNRHTDRSGANKLLAHAVGRITIINVEHDVEDWTDWAINNGVSSDVIAYIQNSPQSLWRFDAKDNNPQPSPRSWVRLSDTYKTNPPSYLQQRMFEGDVGEVEAIEFSTFLRLKDRLPNLKDIVTGKDVDVLEDVGLSYLSSVALMEVVSKASDKDRIFYFENALSWIEKMPSPEFAIFFARGMVKKYNELTNTKKFSEFKVRHSDLEV